MKHRTKQCFSLLLALCLLLTAALPAGYTAAATIVDSGTCGVVSEEKGLDGTEVTWTLDSDGLLAISGSGAIMSCMEKSPWSKHRSTIKTIHIGSGIDSIGSFAFSGFSELTDIEISEGVTSIGSVAFQSCSKLKSIKIPNSVTSIGDTSFNYCIALKSITIPSNVEYIGSEVFLQCKELMTITVDKNNKIYHSAGNCLIKTEEKILIAGCKTSQIPTDGTVTKIGHGAFRGITGLTTVTIPNSVTEIGYNAFSGCKGLTKVTIPNSVKKIGSSAFESCSGLTSITIPNSVTKLEYCTFEYCSGLTSITIPNNVTEIHSSVFGHCTGLRSFTVEQNNKEFHVTGNCLIKTKEKTLIAGCKSSVIPTDGSVTKIQSSAFRGITGLTSVTIPNSVTEIGKWAFYSCTGLTSIKIPNSITKIEYGTFMYCTELTTITIPYSVTEIEDAVFSSCSALTDVYYSGSENEWNSITSGNSDGYLKRANIFYNNTGPTVTFDANGGIGAPEKQTKTLEIELILSTITPKKTCTITYNANGGSMAVSSKLLNAEFKSWNTKQDGSGTSYAPGATYKTDASVTLFAQWTDPKAGDLPTLTRTGYSFAGWYTEASGGTQITKDSTITADTTLYAHWTPCSHQWKEGTVTKQPTCTAAGEKLYTCKVCSETKTESIAKLGHDFTKQTVNSSTLYSAATCTAKAKYYYSCSRCNEIEKNANHTFQSGSALGHSYTSTSTDAAHLKTAATCTAKAVYYKSCVRCGLNGTETFTSGNALGHSYTKQTANSNTLYQAATCTAKAKYYYSCSRCNTIEKNASHTFESGNTLGHSYTKQTISSDTLYKAATCTAKAKYYYSCSRCNAIEKNTNHTFENGSALGHDFGAWTKLSDTQHQRVCSRDKTHVEIENHTWDSGKATTPATCTTAGVKTYTCSVCKATKTETVKALGHDYGAWTKLDETYHRKVCKNDKSHVIKENHSWNSGIETKTPTAADTGERTYTCSVCKGTKTESIYLVAYDATGSAGAPVPQKKTEGVDITLSSIRPTKTYTLTYNANGGTSPDLKTVDAAFKNWNTKADGTGTSYAPGGIYKTNASATLYAQWTEPRAGGLVVPVRTDYSFTGWYTKAIGGTQITADTVITESQTLYAHWKPLSAYSLGEETYSFENYDFNDPNCFCGSLGHCHGMTATGAGYYLDILDVSKIGISSPQYLHTVPLTREPANFICYYQKIQGTYLSNAIVAGGSYNYKKDWNAVLDYVKDHSHEGKGDLEVCFRLADNSGHATNFLRYAQVNGQDRIYVYDNNYPAYETYFYLSSNGIRQAPYETFQGAPIVFLALVDVAAYFENTRGYDPSRTIYGAKDQITVKGAVASYMYTDAVETPWLMYELPADAKMITITPQMDYAKFTYEDQEFDFGDVNENTFAVLTLSEPETTPTAPTKPITPEETTTRSEYEKATQPSVFPTERPSVPTTKAPSSGDVPSTYSKMKFEIHNAASAVLSGDVDKSSDITSADARLALRAAVGLENYGAGSASFLAADASHDGAITSEDARLILRAAVGLETLT